MPASVRPEPADARDARGVLEYIGHAPTDAALRVRMFPRAARPVRALRLLGLCWGLAVVAVFLPLLHFVLVPGLLLAGLFLGARALGDRASVLSVRGTCPACAQPLELALREPARETLAFRCPACGRSLTLRPDPALLAD